VIEQEATGRSDGYTRSIAGQVTGRDQPIDFLPID
jgi:hypothetical protein